VWSPYKKGDADAIEKVQKRATKFVNYIDRPLGFPTLKYRRLRGDMIEVFKITKHKYDYKVAPE